MIQEEVLCKSEVNEQAAKQKVVGEKKQTCKTKIYLTMAWMNFTHIHNAGVNFIPSLDDLIFTMSACRFCFKQTLKTSN